MTEAPRHPMRVPPGGRKVRVRFTRDVRVCEWVPRREVGLVVDFEAGTELNVTKLTAPDSQGAIYLRTPWGSDIYVGLNQFEVMP